MIQQIKNNLKKYHEANLWLEQAYVREEKKLALGATTDAATGYDAVYKPAISQPQVVFTHYDTGHNQEETNRIQELYNELSGLPLSPRLATV